MQAPWACFSKHEAEILPYCLRRPGYLAPGTRDAEGRIPSRKRAHRVCLSTPSIDGRKTDTADGIARRVKRQVS